MAEEASSAGARRVIRAKAALGAMSLVILRGGLILHAGKTAISETTIVQKFTATV
jgi:hypothetical protein